MVIQSQPDLLLVGQAENAEDALSQFPLIRPDVTIMDQRLPGASCTDTLIAVRKESPRAIVMMATASKQGLKSPSRLGSSESSFARFHRNPPMWSVGVNLECQFDQMKTMLRKDHVSTLSDVAERA